MLSSQQLATLWRKHAAALVLLARTYGDVAEDCVQEAFVRLATQEPVPDNPAAWLFRVVRNEAITQLRSQQRRRHREMLVAQGQSRWFEASTFTEHTLASIDVEQALCSLESTTRDILVAHLWGGMTFRDIAEAFELSRARTHRTYQQGIQQLQQIFHSEVDR